MSDDAEVYGDCPEREWPDLEIPWEIQSDLNALVLGEQLGAGISRTVYRSLIDPAMVFKIETHGAHFQNVMEWRVWRSLENDPLGEHLAPCHAISPNGAVLIQSWVDMSGRVRLPPDLPHFLTACDMKHEHWGRMGKRVVCVDYALIGQFLRETLSGG